MSAKQTESSLKSEDIDILLQELLDSKRSFLAYKAAADKYVVRDELTSARKIYQTYISQFLEEPDGYRELGVIQEYLKDFDGQLESYQRALSLSDDQPYWLYITLARLLAKKGKKTEAIALYQQSLECSCGEADGLGYAELARLLSEQGKVAEALDSYQKAIELNPALDWVSFCIQTLRYNQGIAQLAVGNFDMARRCFADVEQVKPSWEASVWFKKEGTPWPHYQSDYVGEFNKLKDKDVPWPKISIVTPSFNQGDFIEETILSILNQGYENVEYIVIDGGSTDSTLQTLDKYKDKISITLLESDRGQSNAINKGFRLATGELFSWLNSDDILSPGALYEVALTYLKSDCDVIAGICATHQNQRISMVRKPKIRQENFTVEALKNFEQWEAGEFFFQPEVFFSRQIWERAGGGLNENLYYSMDHELWIRFAQANAKLKVIDWPLAFFRNHVRQKTANRIASQEELLKIMGLQVSHQELVENPNKRRLREEEFNTIEPERHTYSWDLNRDMIANKTTKSSSLVESIEVARELLNKEQWNKLHDLCSRIVVEYPNNAESYVWLGLAQEKLGDFNQQLRSYQQAIKLDTSQDDWVYLVAAQRLIGNRQWEQAFYLLEETLKIYPESDEAYRWIGICQQNMGDIQGQILSHQKAVELSPQQPRWLYKTLHEAYVKIGDTENASRILNEQGVMCDGEKETLGVLDKLGVEENKADLKENEFCGRYFTYPDLTGKRQLEGGLRTTGRGKGGKSKGKRPLVSVITAVYNNSDTFSRCINSVINQSYDNVEYIVIDGGSDRPTLDLILQHSEDIDYFVSEPDRGIYNAMNKGIELAQGDYICVLNSDDWYSPEFVSSCVEVALREKSSVAYTFCNHSGEQWSGPGMNAGIFLGHLNINHASFLVSRECYNNIGRYSEEYKIVSDMLWKRNAFAAGEKFDLVPDFLFNFSDGGLSSGNDLDRRNLMFAEIRSITEEVFDFLSKQEIDDIYLFRFNASKIESLLRISERYKEHKLFSESLAHYVDYCFRYRDCCRLSHTESDGLFPLFLEAVETFSLSKTAIRINTRYGCFSKIVESIDDSIAQRKHGRGKTILHYVFNFSTPSETFIYDLLNRLEGTIFDNYILFDNRILEDERPYNKSFHIHWAGFRPEIRNELYRYIFEKLKPDAVIAHFAINEWKLWQRLQPLSINVPTISMTHGIDVFSMGSKPEYKDYILNNFSNRKNTGFTTVSQYLESELRKHGVPEDKVTLIHNTVNDRFFKHRKTGNFFDKNRRLNLLNIGRLIDWKGHIHLLEGFKYFKGECYDDTHLTIVYGNGTDYHAQVVAKISELGLNDSVSLIPFVDFSARPDFFQDFDLFIQPSTYSTDGLNKSETFGVAALEAISAGLPVIVSDAGGLPEVVGEESQFATIVPHADGMAIGKALQKMFERGECFADNLEYAEARLSSLSSQKQVSLLGKKIIHICQGKLNATIFSSGTIGGAGYAAFRIHKGLSKTSISSTILTKTRQHASYPGVEVIPHPIKNGDAWNLLQDPSISREGLTIFTLNHPVITTDMLDEMVETADVISLHWVARFLSVENIAHLSSIGKPVVITIRDMNPLTGGCHYFHGCHKWKSDCSDCPQLIDNFDNFPQKVLEAKRKNYNFENITIVTLSQHTADIVKQSPYFNRCRLEVIPNSIETNVFKPSDKIEARKSLGLPLDRQIIGYVPSFSSTVKGYKEVIAAFEIIKERYSEIDPFVMLVGNETPANKAIKLDNKSIGYIDDNDKLAVAYSAADVVIVPSLEETFSNTTAEAISCGKPVVGFRTGAIADMVTDGVTGYTYPVGDYKGLAEGIFKVLTSENMFTACRAYSRKNLSFMNQAIKYEELFYDLYLSSKLKKTKKVHLSPSYFSETTQTIMNIMTSNLLSNA